MATKYCAMTVSCKGLRVGRLPRLTISSNDRPGIRHASEKSVGGCFDGSTRPLESDDGQPVDKDFGCPELRPDACSETGQHTRGRRFSHCRANTDTLVAFAPGLPLCAVAAGFNGRHRT